MYPVAFLCHGWIFSMWAASPRARASPNLGAVICIPTGTPWLSSPIGTLTAGWPVKFASLVFSGLGVGALWKGLSWIFNLFLTEVGYSAPRTSQFPNATINVDLSPEYMGVGYVIGPRIAGTMVAGGVLSWLVLLPLLRLPLKPQLLLLQPLLPKRRQTYRLLQPLHQKPSDLNP